MKKLLLLFIGLFLSVIAALAAILFITSAKLPPLFTLKDYKPLLVTNVYDRNGQEYGEFSNERRIILPADQIPDKVKYAFISAEDSTFFEHGGLNYIAIIRATLANLKAGKKVQGGSTITQQVAKSLLLTPEKTFTRKIKEALLAYRIEKNFSKNEILYLYLNQIFLGQHAYGIEMASRTYFRKSVKDLSVAEAAILAGLPQAPSRYSPSHNPQRAKERQVYVLNRMAENGYITKEEAKKYMAEPITVYRLENFKDEAPYYLETVRQYLVKTLGESAVLDQGLRVYTPIDVTLQKEAQKQVRDGLRAVDKRQGFRGAEKNLTTAEDVSAYLLTERNRLMNQKNPQFVIQPDGNVETPGQLVLTRQKKSPKEPNLPDYVAVGDIVNGIVMKVEDDQGLTTVRFGESLGLIDLDTMKWARKPDPALKAGEKEITKPSDALKVGDLIEVKILADRFTSPRLMKKFQDLAKVAKAKKQHPPTPPDFSNYVGLVLEQEPIVEGALLSFDVKTGDILSMVGGYSFEGSEFNRAIQAARQTGSSFKPIVYAAAFDKGYNAASTIVDSPVVFDGDTTQVEDDGEFSGGGKTGEAKKWKPSNYEGKFTGDVLFRNALVHSMNIPTVKIMQDLGVNWVSDYSRRLGIYNKLNMDLGMGLGSSSVSLYELTKVFATFARLGKKIQPTLITKVTDASGKELVNAATLDARFENEMKPFEEEYEKRRQEYLAALNDPNTPQSQDLNAPVNKRKIPRIYFQDEKQLMEPSTAYLITSVLQAVVQEGTGARAKALGRPVAGKTGTTNGFYDAWFMGFTPQIVTGVWVGYDTEKTIGKGETGAAAALPIWVEYMKKAHENLPIEYFSTPDKIVFANIDNQTGKLASAASREVVKQAFLEGTEPQVSHGEASPQEEKDFLKEDVSQ